MFKPLLESNKIIVEAFGKIKSRHCVSSFKIDDRGTFAKTYCISCGFSGTVRVGNHITGLIFTHDCDVLRKFLELSNNELSK